MILDGVTEDTDLRNTGIWLFVGRVPQCIGCEATRTGEVGLGIADLVLEGDADPIADADLCASVREGTGRRGDMTKLKSNGRFTGEIVDERDEFSFTGSPSGLPISRSLFTTPEMGVVVSMGCCSTARVVWAAPVASRRFLTGVMQSSSSFLFVSDSVDS